MKEIPLTQGQVAIVDDEDYDELSKYKWCAHYRPSTKSFYAKRGIRLDSGKQTMEWMHRRILCLQYKDGKQVDHKNHNTLDNRKDNLKITDNRGNSENRKDQSKYGVGIRFRDWKSKRYAARAYVNGKEYHIGMFDTIEEARKARQEYIIKNDPDLTQICP